MTWINGPFGVQARLNADRFEWEKDPVASAPASLPAPAPTPAPTPKPKPAPGTVLYQADWSSPAGAWPAPSNWKFPGGMMVVDGGYYSAPASTALAPYRIDDTSDYAIEAEMQVLNPKTVQSFIGLIGRQADGKSGYLAGIASGWNRPSAYIVDVNANALGSVAFQDIPFDPETAWHTYRFEMKENQLKLLVDGKLAKDLMDNRFLTGRQVGLMVRGFQVNVRSFKVIAL